MKGFTFAATAALLSTTYAATVKIQETPCISNNTELAEFDVTVGTLYVQAFESVCGFKIASADGVDVKSVKCQAYKDAEGKEKGSAEFTADSPALIATNPVQEGSILCSTGDAVSATATLSTVATPSASGGSAPGGGNSTSPGKTGTPTQPNGPGSTTGTGAPESTGAASTFGMSMGALAAAAFAAAML